MNAQTKRISKRDVTAALRTSFPIIVTFLVLGAGYGILMQKHGYGPVWSLVSGVIIFSGTAQFVSVSMLHGGSLLMAAVTALLVSARHIFFSISMIGRYRAEGRRKWYLYYALCDESYAMLSRDETPEGVDLSAYRLLVTLFDQSAWVLGSFLGGSSEIVKYLIEEARVNCNDGKFYGSCGKRVSPIDLRLLLGRPGLLRRPGPHGGRVP